MDKMEALRRSIMRRITKKGFTDEEVQSIVNNPKLVKTGVEWIGISTIEYEIKRILKKFMERDK